MSTKWRKYPEELIQKAKELYSSGMPMPEIEEAVQIGHKTLYKWFKRDGFEVARRRKPSVPKPPPKTKYSEAQVLAWGELYKSGKSVRQIAAEVGVYAPTIYNYFRKHGIATKLENEVLTAEKLKLKARRQILKKYGLTLEGYEELWKAHSGVCAICKEPASGGRGSASKLHVDHNHATGLNRGLLCGRCNVGIGNFRDRPDLLEAAAKYLVSYYSGVSASG